MLTYLHLNVFPYIGYICGYVGTIASMGWVDGLRFLFGLPNTDGVQYIITNAYDSVQTVLNWSSRVDGGLFDIVGDVVYNILYSVITPVFPPNVPLWVAFLFVSIGALIAFNVVKFFLGILF